MSDAYVTREMRIRDLLAHRSGLSLGAGDLLYWLTTTYSTTREVAERLKDVPLTGGFREQYAYDNILFGVAGWWSSRPRDVVPAVPADPHLGSAGHARNPLQQRRPQARRQRRRATPSSTSGPAPGGVTSWRNVSGAGGIYSSVHDLAKWMNAAAGRRRIPGRRQAAVLGAAPARMWTGADADPVGKPFGAGACGGAERDGLRAGWQLSDYAGHRLVWHTGGWPGQVRA